MDTLGEAASLGLSMFAAGSSAKQFGVNGNKLRSMKIKEKIGSNVGKIAGKVKSGAGTLWHDNRGIVDFEAPVLGSGRNSNKILWGKWEDYKHVFIGNNEYAEVGERFYTRHAVARMQPSGMRYTNVSAGGKVKASRIINAGELDYGRSISPNYIEDIINTDKVSTQVVDDVTRTVFSSGTVDIITEQDGKIVVTILTH